MKVNVFLYSMLLFWALVIEQSPQLVLYVRLNTIGLTYCPFLEHRLLINAEIVFVCAAMCTYKPTEIFNTMIHSTYTHSQTDVSHSNCKPSFYVR